MLPKLKLFLSKNYIMKIKIIRIFHFKNFYEFLLKKSQKKSGFVTPFNLVLTSPLLFDSIPTSRHPSLRDFSSFPHFTLSFQH